MLFSAVLFQGWTGIRVESLIQCPNERLVVGGGGGVFLADMVEASLVVFHQSGSLLW